MPIVITGIDGYLLINLRSTDANNVKTKLGTPEFLGVVESFPIKFDEKELYKINNETLQIGYKKI